MTEPLEAVVRCLNKVFGRGVDISNITGAQSGNCSICAYDPDNNKHCAKYSPIYMYVFEVLEQDKPPEP